MDEKTYGDADFKVDVEGFVAALPPDVEFISGKLSSRTKKLRALLNVPIGSGTAVSAPRGIYRFESPHYVREVQLHGPDIAEIKKSIRVTAKRIDGTVVEVKLSEWGKGTTEAQCYAFVNGFVESFELSTKRTSSVRLSAVKVSGYPLSELDQVAEKITASLALSERASDYIANLKSSAAESVAKTSAAADELATLAETRAEAVEEVSELERQIATYEKSVLETKAVLEAEKAKLDRAQKDLVASKNNREQLDAIVTELNGKLGRLRSELQSLANDRSIISDEYRDYVKEGRSQSTVYAVIAGIALIGALVCAGFLINGANNYLAIAVTEPKHAYALFLQRLPFSSAIILSITLLLGLAKLLIESVFKIHSSRLALAKLLVIAKDTVFTAAAGLNLPDEVRFRERIRLKIQMLKAYMTAELGDAFEVEKEPEPDPPKEDDE